MGLAWSRHSHTAVIQWSLQRTQEETDRNAPVQEETDRNAPVGTSGCTNWFHFFSLYCHATIPRQWKEREGEREGGRLTESLWHPPQPLLPPFVGQYAARPLTTSGAESLQVSPTSPCIGLCGHTMTLLRLPHELLAFCMEWPMRPEGTRHWQALQRASCLTG